MELYKTKDGLVFDVSDCECVDDVVEKVFGYSVYYGWDYIGNFLDGFDKSDESIKKLFNTREQMAEFEKSKSSVVFIGFGRTIFLCSTEQVDESILIERWLEKEGEFLNKDKIKPSI